MSNFQTQVNVQPAPGVVGDYASHNPRYSVDAGPGGLIAGPSGAIVGRFGWATYPSDGDGAPAVVNMFGAGLPTGFLHREQQGLITVYLQEASLMVPPGFGVTLMSGGDFWVVNSGASQALPGMKAYADLATGLITFAAPNTVAAGGSATGTIAAGSSSFTGSITGDVLSVTAVASGTIYPGTGVSGGGTAAGTQVVSQLSGTPGGVGTYAVNIPEQNVASAALTGAYGTFTAVSGLTGSFGVGQQLQGTNVVGGTTITALGTGIGGLGTYIVNNNTVVSSTAISAVGSNIETKWYCRSSGLPGEIVKMSSQPLG
jgi:hypothetical protein